MRKPEVMQKSNVHSKIDKGKVAVWSINDDYFAGKPDCHYEAINPPTEGRQSRELWIEYKHLKELPKLLTTVVKPRWSSDLQETILTRKFLNRGNARVVLFIGSGRGCKAVMFNNNEEWSNGLTKEECERRAVPLAEIARFIERFVTDEND